MTELLEAAIARSKTLPTDKQDAIAQARHFIQCGEVTSTLSKIY
jgi:hypothetical protein